MMKHILDISEFINERLYQDPVPRAEAETMFESLVKVIQKRQDVFKPIKSVGGYDIIWPCIDVETPYRNVIIRLIPGQDYGESGVYGLNSKGFYSETITWKVLQLACLHGDQDRLHIASNIQRVRYVFVKLFQELTDISNRPKIISYDSGYVNDPNTYEKYYNAGILKIEQVIQDRYVKAYTKKWLFPEDPQKFIERSVVFFDISWIGSLPTSSRSEYIERLIKYHTTNIIPFIHEG